MKVIPRRGAVAVLFGAVVAAAGVAVTTFDRSPDGAQQELAERLRRSVAPDRFEFHHRAGGSTLLDCFLPNRDFWGAVDYQSGVLVLRTPRSAETPTAMVADGRAVLHRSLFGADAVPTTWVQVDRPAKPTTRAALARILGVDLAEYILAEGLPPSGRATALAALDVAREVKRIGSQDIGAVEADGYLVSVDPERFTNEASPSAASNADAAQASVPTFEVWLAKDHAVVRIVVQAQRIDDDPPAAETAGWTIDYLPRDSVVYRPPPDVTAFDALDASAGRPAAAADCKVPS